jgi:hypothetical protein
MAKKETNDAKREDMKALVTMAITKGWTQATLAGYFGYSSFSPFAKGTSMGTNSLRSQLVGLGSFTEMRVDIFRRIGELLRMVAKAEAELAEAQAKQPPTEAKYMAGQMGEYVRKYPEHYSYAKGLESYASGKEWSINRAQNNLASATKWLNALQKAVK